MSVGDGWTRHMQIFGGLDGFDDVHQASLAVISYVAEQPHPLKIIMASHSVVSQPDGSGVWRLRHWCAVVFEGGGL